MPARARLFAFGLSALAVVAGCTSTRRVYDVTSVDRPPDVTSDSLAGERARARVQYAAEAHPLNDVAPDRTVDVLASRIDVRPDLATRTVVGTVEHDVVPLRDSLTAFALHGVHMDIERVTASSPAGVTLSVDYDSTRLTLIPSRPLMRSDTLTFDIAYTAHPERSSGDDLFAGKGMYFIDPDGTDPYRPTQIWTQGETEDSRRWFPTWDYPNDKMTLAIAVTVPDSFQTFSNGTLLGSDAVAGGLRRDRWDLGETPVTAYLAAIAAGDFAVVDDTYRREDGTAVPLQYVVEPRFESQVPAIFGETPRMIGVYERVFGVRYPWPNYKQVTVRDFTAGGMENASVTIMYEGLQRDPAGLLGNEMDLMDLVSHELAHQWFGDLTTTEDWANITVNEGMATWSEAIYRERAHGMDAAQQRRIEDWEQYLAQAARGRRPIVWYGYGDNVGQMFDAHTYQKGGRVFEQLRFELGDAVFFRGLQRFLTEHGGRNVELTDFRQAMEAESGRGLQHFFDQWFRSPGHPALVVEQAWFPGSSLYTVEVTQTQDRTHEPLFDFEVLVELNYPDGTRETHRERVATADTTLRYRVAQRPSWVRFDAGDHVPAAIALTVPTDELVAMLRADEELAARYDAVVALAAMAQSPQIREALQGALTRDAHPLVRRRAASALGAYLRSAGVGEALTAAITTDADPNVRSAAIAAMGELPADGPFLRAQAAPALRTGLADPADKVVARAVGVYQRLIPREAYDAYAAAGLFERQSWGGVVERPLIVALDSLGDRRALGYLTDRVGRDNPDNVREAAARALAHLGAVQPGESAAVRTALLERLDDPLVGVRLGAARGLARVGTSADLPAIEARIAVEDDDDVKTALQAAAQRIRGGGSRTALGQSSPIGTGN